MIKNIIFDMGNVLLRYDPEVALKKFCRDENEKNIIRRELFESNDWQNADRGLILESEKFDKVKPRVADEHLPALKNCCDNWDVCMKPLPGAIEFCRRAKADGFRLFVLSNASDAFHRIFPREMPMELFDGCVVSADVKAVKPDEKIYRHLLNTYSLNPAECVFFDDNAENVAAAQAIGITAMVFDGDFEAAAKIIY